jgi:hypothetical protein
VQTHAKLVQQKTKVKGMEHSEKLCIACADACNALVAASKTDSNLDALCKM